MFEMNRFKNAKTRSSLHRVGRDGAPWTHRLRLPTDLVAPLFALGFAGAVGFAPSSAASETSNARYALFQETVSVTKIPVLKDVVQKTRSVAVLDLDRQEKRLFGSGPLCSLATESESSVLRTHFPPAFVRSLPPIQVDGALSVRDGKTFFRQDEQVLVLGAKLKNPSRDPLPESPKDARVYDQDGDGHPGMTVRITGFVKGDVYVAQRNRTRLDGVENKEGFTGEVRLQTERRILDASSSMLKKGGVPVEDPSRSRFVLRKVPSGWGCEQALAWAKAKF